MASQMSACFFIAMVVLGVSFAQAQGPVPAPTSGAPVPFVAPVGSPPAFTVPTVAPVVAPALPPTIPPPTLVTPVVAPATAPPPPASIPTVTPASTPVTTVAEAPAPGTSESAGVMTSPFAWKGLVVASALVAALAY